MYAFNCNKIMGRSPKGPPNEAAPHLARLQGVLLTGLQALTLAANRVGQAPAVDLELLPRLHSLTYLALAHCGLDSLLATALLADRVHQA